MHCRKRIGVACWPTQTVYVRCMHCLKKFSFRTPETTVTVLLLYDSESQTEGALTLKAFADNASAIRGTECSISTI